MDQIRKMERINIVKKDWFRVDKEGLAQILERKGKAFLVLELIQNSWDEDGVTRVDVKLNPVNGKSQSELIVTDDAPDGFKDLTHAYTLFAESNKKGIATKRGRYNLGEKLVLALCKEATIISTTGGYRFDKDGRHTLRKTRKSGSEFKGILKLTRKEHQDVCDAVNTLLPPENIVTTFNEEEIVFMEPLQTTEATLQTELSDENGNIRRTKRKTLIEVHGGTDEEEIEGMLYEMGIPVVTTGDKWHINIMQKVPLNLDRDNVPPAYLRKIRSIALNLMATMMETEDSVAPWVQDAMEDENTTPETVDRIIKNRFGENVAIFDPSDPEANKKFQSRGGVILHGGTYTKSVWEKVKQSGNILPAGQITPSEKPFSDDPGAPSVRYYPKENWTHDMIRVISYTKKIAECVIKDKIEVIMINDMGMNGGAAYGARRMYFNVARLGKAWFGKPLIGNGSVLELIIHELGHEYSHDHLSSEYYAALCQIGSKLAYMVMENPKIFLEDYYVSATDDNKENER